MKWIFVLLMGVLGSPLFSRSLFFRLSLSGSLIYWQEIRADHEARKKLKQKLYPKGKWRRSAPQKAPHLKLKGTNPKCHRFSNQRRLRRMFRNA